MYEALHNEDENNIWDGDKEGDKKEGKNGGKKIY